ncbi:MAG TPA: ATP-binding protein [Ktedonobacteraceae bacterium]|nr:ATP-binding protein [Ktedonobacteraceae bacterium]
MERLNDILGRVPQKRQQHPGPRSSNSADASEAGYVQPQRPELRRPLPEQTARQGQQRNTYSSQHSHQYLPTTKVRPIQEQGEPAVPENREGRVYGSTGPRPLYPRQPLPGRPGTRYEGTRSRPPRSRMPESDDYLRGDSYAANMHADVIEEWEEDAVDMRYGDWERDGDEALLHQPIGSEPIDAPRSRYVSGEYPLTNTPEMEPRSRPTRDLRMSGVHPPLLPPRTQSAQRFQQQRMTQPLNPQSVMGLGRERESVQEAVQYAPRQMRQLVPYAQEQYAPAPALPPARGCCPKCRGAGYLRADVPFGHPNFGKPIACECKEAERRERRRQQLRDMSNLDAFRNNSFRTFNPSVPGLREAYQTAAAYAENPQGWLLLVGPNGCGKTHLAAAIANQCLDNGSVVLFAVVPDLLDHLRAAFAPTASEVYDQLFSKMREAEVLVLDDLGAQQSSPWANEKLFQLLNYRYNMSMPTVITANPRGLQGIDERIRSRLSDVSLMTRVTFDRAHDYRPNHPRREL